MRRATDPAYPSTSHSPSSSYHHNQPPPSHPHQHTPSPASLAAAANAAAYRSPADPLYPTDFLLALPHQNAVFDPYQRHPNQIPYAAAPSPHLQYHSQSPYLPPPHPQLPQNDPLAPPPPNPNLEKLTKALTGLNDTPYSHVESHLNNPRLHQELVYRGSEVGVMPSYPTHGGGMMMRPGSAFGGPNFGPPSALMGHMGSSGLSGYQRYSGPPGPLAQSPQSLIPEDKIGSGSGKWNSASNDTTPVELSVSKTHARRASRSPPEQPSSKRPKSSVTNDSRPSSGGTPTQAPPLPPPVPRRSSTSIPVPGPPPIQHVPPTLAPLSTVLASSPPPKRAPALLTPSQKKANHIQSEQKRRATIRKGYEALCEVVPSLREVVQAGGPGVGSVSTGVAAWAAGGVEEAPKRRRGKVRDEGRPRKRKSREKEDEDEGGLGGVVKSEALVLTKTIEHIQQLLSNRDTLLAERQHLSSLLPPSPPNSRELRPWEAPWAGGSGLPPAHMRDAMVWMKESDDEGDEDDAEGEGEGDAEGSDDGA